MVLRVGILEPYQYAKLLLFRAGLRRESTAVSSLVILPNKNPDSQQNHETVSHIFWSYFWANTGLKHMHSLWPFMSYQDEDTPLHLAAWQGHSQIVTLLIEAKAEIDARNSVSSVPVLHLGKLEPSFGYFYLHKNIGSRIFPIKASL